jgi:hypothetical protein
MRERWVLARLAALDNQKPLHKYDFGKLESTSFCTG